MKRFVFLLAGFVFLSVSGWANYSSFNSWNNTQNQSFIFMENDIEFSVFQDGHFDFFMPNYGPNLSVGFNGSNASFSFNSGYNYNPYVQYDSYGAVVQIQNTPVYYDYFGRINQVGTVFINYNTFGRINRIGGLQLFYRNNMFWRQSGFVNHLNRNYAWRPWHSYYAVPAAHYSLISYQPYRQFYSPVRHIYYRPYMNNSRDFAFNREQPNYRPNTNNSRSQRYAQTPRTSSERNVRSNVQRHQAEIDRARNSRVSNVNSTTRGNSRAISEVSDRTNRDVTSRTNRTAQEVNSTSRRSQVSSRVNRNTNTRSISQSSPRTEQVRSNTRNTSEVSRRNSAPTKQVSNTRTSSRTERSTRATSNRSARSR